MTRHDTQRKHKILDFIQAYQIQHGYPPSIREIGAAVGLRSTASVARHLKSLEDEGYITHPPLKGRAWTVRHAASHQNIQVPLIGKITAGLPILATEQVEDNMTFPVSLFGQIPDFLLRVVGDSMIEAGIFDRDIVAVRETALAETHTIVIARIGDEATVKYLDITPHGYRLLPANPHYEPIESPDITIVGRVIGLIRAI